MAPTETRMAFPAMMDAMVDAKSKHELSFDVLFDRHHRALWRLALRMTGNPDHAQDLVQETFLKVMTRPKPCHLRSAEGWLVRTLVNLCRDLHRKHRVRRKHVEVERAESAGDSLERGSEAAVLARLTVARGLERLSPRRRAVLVLHELEGLDTGRVAELLGLRPATVRWHLAAARKQLAVWIERSGRREER